MPNIQMEGNLEKFNMCCLLCNIKLKKKNFYIKGIWRFLTGDSTSLQFNKRSIVEKDFLVVIAQKPDCLDSDLFPGEMRVFGKKINDILIKNRNVYRLECSVESSHFDHTVLFIKVPVTDTQEEISEETAMPSPNTNKEHNDEVVVAANVVEHSEQLDPNNANSQKDNDSDVVVVSSVENSEESVPNNDIQQQHDDKIVVVPNVDIGQAYESDNAEESVPNNDIKHEHNDDEIVMPNVDIGQAYKSDNAEESVPNNDNDDEVIVVSNIDIGQAYKSGHAEESVPNNDRLQELNDDEGAVLSSDDMWQDYLSDNAEESVPNNDRLLEHYDNLVQIMSENYNSDFMSNISRNAELISSDNNDSGISESRRGAQRRDSEDFSSVICNIPRMDLCKLVYSVQNFLKKSNDQVTFPHLTASERLFLVTIVSKPHLLVTGEGLPLRLKQVGMDVLALLKQNKDEYKWECVSSQDTVTYKKIHIPGCKVPNASKSQSTVLDIKMTKQPLSGDCVTMDPEKSLNPSIEKPIFWALLEKIKNDIWVLSFFKSFKEFLVSHEKLVTFKPKTHTMTEFIFKISARIAYMDTDMFPEDSRAVGCEILKLLRDNAPECNVTCLVNGQRHNESITFQKMRATDQNQPTKEKQKVQHGKRSKLQKARHMEVDNQKLKPIRDDILQNFQRLRKLTEMIYAESRAGVRRRLIYLTRIVTFLMKDWCRIIQFTTHMDEAEFLVMIACEPWMRRSAYMDDIPEAYRILVDAVDECMAKFDLVYAYPTLQIPRKSRSRRSTNLPSSMNNLVQGLNTPFASPLTQRMMANMGWTGGALGKYGEGISTPIMPNLNQVKNAGLGYVYAKKGKNIEKPAPKGQQYHMMMRLLEVLWAFLDDDSVDTTYVDVADLDCEEFPRSAANIIAFINRREVMYNIGVEEQELFQEVVNQMMCDQNLVLRHSVDTDTRINIFKVSLSIYKETVRSQRRLDVRTESTRPNEYNDALFKSLEAPITTPTSYDVQELDDDRLEINNNNLLQSIENQNYEELFVNPREFLKVHEDLDNDNTNEGDVRSWYDDERNWNDQAGNGDLVERLARDLLECRQRLTEDAQNDKTRVLGLMPLEESNVIDEETAKVVQKNILNELNKLPHKSAIKLKCFGIRNDMLIYQALNEVTYDWLVGIVKHIKVRIFDFNIEENNCRGLLVASNYAIENDEELIERIKEFNESVDVSAWYVLNSFQLGSQRSYEVVIDRKSLMYIFNNNCSLNLGIDQAEFVFVGTL